MMNKQGRVLVVDDLKLWREALVKILQSGGFFADSASSVTEVLKQLDETFYHLLLLDVRLNDADPTDQEGVALLPELKKRGLSEAMKVIMISAYGDKEQTRKVFQEYGVAGFVFKDDFNEEKFLQTVRRVFAEKMNINLALDIQWQLVSGPEQIVADLEMGETYNMRDPANQQQIAIELEDLLCRLFYQAESILVRPMTPGQSGTGVLLAQPFFPEGGGGRPVVVKFGRILKIEEEYRNFKRYVEHFIGGGRNTTVRSLRRTPHLGGIMYSLLGTTNDNLEDFGSFYSHAPVLQIQDALDRLFTDTCGAWYANPGRLQPYNLTEDYRKLLKFTPEKLEQALSDLLESVHGKQKLYFKSLTNERAFTNPLLVMAGLPLRRPTYICTMHGDFNQHNILVDNAANMWLIDFLRTGPGHILRDFCELDSVVRFQLLAAEEATLEERLQMEEVLCSIDRFSQLGQLENSLHTDNLALAKAYTTVVHLRKLAHKLVIHNDDISEYFIALFYYALNTFRFSDLPVQQREHALLAASLLADRLGLKA